MTGGNDPVAVINGDTLQIHVFISAAYIYDLLTSLWSNWSNQTTNGHAGGGVVCIRFSSTSNARALSVFSGAWSLVQVLLH